MYLERTAKFKIRTFDLLKITFCFAMFLDLNKFIRKFHNCTMMKEDPSNDKSFDYEKCKIN